MKPDETGEVLVVTGDRELHRIIGTMLTTEENLITVMAATPEIVGLVSKTAKQANRPIRLVVTDLTGDRGEDEGLGPGIHVEEIIRSINSLKVSVLFLTWTLASEREADEHGLGYSLLFPKDKLGSKSGRDEFKELMKNALQDSQEKLCPAAGGHRSGSQEQRNYANLQNWRNVFPVPKGAHLHYERQKQII